jgi:hypothetical protein
LNTPRTLVRPLPILLALLSVAALGAWWFAHLSSEINTRLEFEDAYMFYRYALNIRHGFGVSWNPDGIHTYGETAPLWGLVVLALSYLPFDGSRVLVLGSAISSFGALLAMAWAAAVNATGKALSLFAFSLALVALPLVLTDIFFLNAATGMETMLAMLLCALFIGLTLLWQRGRIAPELVGLIGLLLFLTRPEAAIAVLLMPTAAFFLLPNITLRGLARLLGIFLLGVLLQMLFCKLYFHTALPLSFSIKSLHGYVGYAGNWKPISAAYLFFSTYKLYLVAIALLIRKPDARLLAVFLVPLLATFAYLLTVTQIMGFVARYYMPYLPFIVIPALLLLDRRLAEWQANLRTAWPRKQTLLHLAAAAAVLLCTCGPVPPGIGRILDRRLYAGTLVYDPVTLHTASPTPLPPTLYLNTMWGVTDTLIAPLPPGAKVAASEVGYLGARAPQVSIIDTAGLNDTQIALHGFNMPALLARRPDILWLPHPDYTYQRGLMLTDPALLQQYDVYAGAANYGLAIRKDSPFHAQIERQWHTLWDQLYPGLNMQDYLVQSVSWTGQKHPGAS